MGSHLVNEGAAWALGGWWQASHGTAEGKQHGKGSGSSGMCYCSGSSAGCRRSPAQDKAQRNVLEGLDFSCKVLSKCLGLGAAEASQLQARAQGYLCVPVLYITEPPLLLTAFGPSAIPPPSQDGAGGALGKGRALGGYNAERSSTHEYETKQGQSFPKWAAACASPHTHSSGQRIGSSSSTTCSSLCSLPAACVSVLTVVASTPAPVCPASRAACLWVLPAPPFKQDCFLGKGYRLKK